MAPHYLVDLTRLYVRPAAGSKAKPQGAPLTFDRSRLGRGKLPLT